MTNILYSQILLSLNDIVFIDGVCVKNRYGDRDITMSEALKISTRVCIQRGHQVILYCDKLHLDVLCKDPCVREAYCKGLVGCLAIPIKPDKSDLHSIIQRQIYEGKN